MKTLGLLILLAFASQSCQTKKTEAAIIANQSATQSKHVDAAEFKKLLESNPNAVLIDVRTAGEVTSSKIKGAQNIDIRSSSFRSKVAELDKSKTYFVYCRSGGRSNSAMNYMSSHGYSVFNLKGGILSWQSSGYNVVK